MSHQKKNRADKLRVDAMYEDKPGIVPRLNELIRLTRWTVYLLVVLSAMLGLFFLRDAISVIIGLFGG
jgi:hypothetical protein